MKRIVVGIDGSEQGWSALERAAELARATGASLQIAHVTSAISPLAGEAYLPTAGWVVAQEAYARAAARGGVARRRGIARDIRAPLN